MKQKTSSTDVKGRPQVCNDLTYKTSSAIEGLKSEQIWGTHFWGKGWGDHYRNFKVFQNVVQKANPLHSKFKI